MYKIMIISDNEAQNNRMKSLLEKDFQVSTSLSAAEGVSIAENEKYELIITEVLMPELSGFEIISKAKNMDHNVIIIAMTSGGIINGEEYLNAIKSYGADMVLKKPFRDGYLLKMINSLMKEYM